MDMTAGQTAIIAVVGILFLISIPLAYSAVRGMSNSFNTGASLGVNSSMAKYAEWFTSLFVVYMPISLVWLGVLLTIITSQYYFTIPTLATIPTCFIISALEAWWPAK